MHGRAFPERVRAAAETEVTLVLPHSVKRELVDDVLDADNTPSNHQAAARTIQELIDEGFLVLRTPDYDTYSDVIDDDGVSPIIRFPNTRSKPISIFLRSSASSSTIVTLNS